MPPGANHRRWLVDGSLVVGLALAALAVRLPNLQLIPAFTDEVYDIQAGLHTAQGKLRPLADAVSGYDGSLWDWLLAAALRLSRYSISAPRLLVLEIAVLTVLATFLVGRAWGGRSAGLLAGLLLATNTVHVVVNSHIAWSNCTTPLFTTLAIWSLGRALDATRRHAGWLLASGLGWGLAVQSHPSAVALLPGVVALVVWRGRWLMRTRWPYLAAALFVLANLNLLVYNLTTGGQSFSVAAQQSARYNQYEPPTMVLYLSHLRELLLGLAQTLAGVLTTQETDLGTLWDPGLWPIVLLAVAGVAWQWRGGNPLLGLLVVSELLLLPWFNRRFHSLPDGRYYMPLLSLLYAGVGVLLNDGLERLHSARTATTWPAWRRQWTRAAMLLGAGWLVLHPLLSLQGFYARMEHDGQTNAPMLQLVQAIKQDQRPSTLVVLDARLRYTHTRLGGGELEGILDAALGVAGVPYRSVDFNGPNLPDLQTSCRDQIVVLAPRAADEQAALADRFGLRDLKGDFAHLADHAAFFSGPYRVTRPTTGC